ncbi:MAG: hypothetical protein ACJ77K_19120 [Bacteroidia bacterium]
MIFLSNNKYHFAKSAAGKFPAALFLLYTLLFLLSGCKTREHIAIKRNAGTTAAVLSPNAPLKIIISSTNLSEDMSTLSTNNDEITLLIYQFVDSTITGNPLASTYTVFDKGRKSDTLVCNNTAEMMGKNLIVFLLEMDSDKKAEQVDPLIRKNYRELAKAYISKNYLEIERLIGDDDILGIEMIDELKHPELIQFSDIHRMDRFDYTIKISN